MLVKTHHWSSDPCPQPFFSSSWDKAMISGSYLLVRYPMIYPMIYLMIYPMIYPMISHYFLINDFVLTIQPCISPSWQTDAKEIFGKFVSPELQSTPGTKQMLGDVGWILNHPNSEFRKLDVGYIIHKIITEPVSRLYHLFTVAPWTRLKQPNPHPDLLMLSRYTAAKSNIDENIGSSNI